MKIRLSDDLGHDTDFTATHKTFRSRLVHSLETWTAAGRPTESARLYVQSPDGRWISPWYPYAGMSVPVNRFVSETAAVHLYRLATQAVRAAGFYPVDAGAPQAPVA